MKNKLTSAARSSPQRHFSITTVAEQLGISTRTVRRWLAAGDLAKHRLGRQIRISESDLSIFLVLRREGSTGGH